MRPSHRREPPSRICFGNPTFRLALLPLLLHLVSNELLGWNRERHELESNVESFVLSKTIGSDQSVHAAGVPGTYCVSPSDGKMPG